MHHNDASLRLRISAHQQRVAEVTPPRPRRSAGAWRRRFASLRRVAPADGGRRSIRPAAAPTVRPAPAVPEPSARHRAA